MPLGLVALGLVGNLLNLLVIGRTCARTSIGALLRAEAVCNLVPLLLYLLPLWFESVSGLSLRAAHALVCKFLPYA